MQKPTPTTDYEHGQMMGMLVIIQIIENSIDDDMGVPASVFDKIKRLAAEDLADYLDKPEEDVYLMVEEELKDLQ